MAISVQWPVDPTKYPITGEYLDTTPPTWSVDRPHLGVDFGCPMGTTVVSATIPGKVHKVHRKGDGWGDSSFGTCIVVDVTGTPYYYLYAHLSAVLVTEGEEVKPGQTIAQSGASGKDGPNTYAPHLHVQVSESPDFPRNLAMGGDPILGVRGSVSAPQPPANPTATLSDIAVLVTAQGNSIATISEAVIAMRSANETRDNNLDSRLTAIEKALDALVKALPKG